MKTIYRNVEFVVLFKMLVCCDDDSLTEDENISPKKESKRFVWNHGSMYF